MSDPVAATDPDAADPEPMSPGQEAKLFDRDEPGRGRAAARPSQIPAKGWRDIFWRVIYSFFGDRLPMVAGGIAYFLLLSLFPAMGAFVALYGLFADAGMVGEQLQGLAGVLPPDVLQIMADQMARIAGAEKGGLSLAFFGSLLVALWSAMTGVKVLFQGLNVAYHETERRNLVKMNLTALFFTLGLFVFSGIVIGAVIVTPAVLSFWGYNSEQGLGLLRWPILLLANVAVMSVLYRYGPSRQLPRWRWVTWGGAFASVLWLFASWAFSWYLANMANYQATYGSLGAFMGFMVWVWLSALVVLLGAEVNAEMEHQTARDTTTGPERTMGERGAVVADTIGARKGVPGAQFTQAAAEELSRRIQLRQARKKMDATKSGKGKLGR
jgi:membrane protein